jgi:UDP-N-acetylmuramate dehydrogenase
LGKAFDTALAKRRQRHPLALPNCGSVFRNPSPTPAAALIERCGLKGYRVGGVEVSSQHANFVVNRGDGRAEQFRTLVRHVQQTVYEREGILLEPEVKFVGRFEQDLFER